MKGQVIIFENAQFGLIRTIQSVSNQPLFCLADLCKALDLGNPSQVKQRLRENGVITNEVIDSMKRVQQLNFVDEPNMYRCIFQSRKKEAELFQDWIFEEVLPSIRKTGRYEVKPVRRTLPRAIRPEMQEFWKCMALMKVGSTIKIPRRRFLGASPEVERAVREIIEENIAEYFRVGFSIEE